MVEWGLRARQLVIITSHFEGQRCRAEKFSVVPYDIPRGNCAVYFPESNADAHGLGGLQEQHADPQVRGRDGSPVEMPAGTRIPASQQVAVPA